MCSMIAVEIVFSLNFDENNEFSKTRTSILLNGDLITFLWVMRLDLEALHFMWDKLSPPRPVDRFAWNVGVITRPGLLHGALFHFRSEPQNRKLDVFEIRKSEPEIENILDEKKIRFLFFIIFF